MILYVLRHGEAEPKNASIRDEERRLSPSGTAQLRKTLSFAKHIGARIDRVISSPLVRAKESSQIAAEVLGIKEILVSNSLEPESEPSMIYSELSKWNENDSMALVTHQPLVTNFLQDLLGIEINMNLQTGSLARVDVEGHPSSGSGTLVYLLSGKIQT